MTKEIKTLAELNKLRDAGECINIEYDTDAELDEEFINMEIINPYNKHAQYLLSAWIPATLEDKLLLDIELDACHGWGYKQLLSRDFMNDGEAQTAAKEFIIKLKSKFDKLEFSTSIETDFIRYDGDDEIYRVIEIKAEY